MPSSYTLAIRKNPNAQDWEVLLGFKEVIDYEHTLDKKHSQNNTILWICNNPGDVVIPGGSIETEIDETSERAAIREFYEETQLPEPQNYQLDLFYTIPYDNYSSLSYKYYYQAYFYLLRAEQNPWMTLSSDLNIQIKNQNFTQNLREIKLDSQGKLTSTLDPKKYSELAHLFWIPLQQVIALYSPNSWRINHWRSNQFKFVCEICGNYIVRPQGRFDLIQKNQRQSVDWFTEALYYLSQNPPQ